MPTPVAMPAALSLAPAREASAPVPATVRPPFTPIPEYRVSAYINGVADRLRDGDEIP